MIYTSMTACYAKDRRSALHDLGDDYDCCCHPEIMKAFICGLNDTDEKVRKKAADEIGDQLRANRCCCSPELTSALTCALGDCDRGVRRQVEEALEECGYEIVDGCCNGCCDDGCCNACGTGSAPAAHAAPAAAPQAPASEAVPAPAPPEEPQAYYPSRLRKTSYSVKSNGGLAELFGLAR
ncbi:MAG: HEAT repeat domain-containing protein [Planctomycetaceae bacterium]